MRTKRGRAGLGLTEFILGWTLLGGGGVLRGEERLGAGLKRKN